MKNCKAAQMYTSAGYPFTVYGKRGCPWIIVEWEWGLEAMRVPLRLAVRYPDTTLSLAVCRRR